MDSAALAVDGDLGECERGRMSEIYDDGGLRIDESGVTIRRYYFPWGAAKRIAYRDLRAVDVRPMGWLTGRGRIWGSGSLRSWLPLDWARPGKQRLVALDVGSLVWPAITPDDPDRVARLLQDRLRRTR